MQKVTVFTDGAARGNPDGPGGYGVICRFTDSQGNEHEREYSCGFAKTTNNRMELMAAIVGLEQLTVPCDVTLYSDSQYLVKAFEEHWIDYWRTHNFTNKQKQPVKNAELWQRLLKQTDRHTVRFEWVKGHNGHPENERCDCLATTAADGTELYYDDGGDLIQPVPVQTFDRPEDEASDIHAGASNGSRSESGAGASNGSGNDSVDDAGMPERERLYARIQALRKQIDELNETLTELEAEYYSMP